MSIFMLLTVPFAVAGAKPDAAPGFGKPVDDAALRAVVGMAGPTTRLSVFVQQQGVTQGQFTGEDLRAGLAVWFADDNLQLIANASLRAG